MTAQSRLRERLVAALRSHLATRRQPDVPEAGRLLWRFFVELSATRTYHPAGPNPISFAEIDAYARANRWPLQHHHVETIRAMDRALLDHTYAGKDASKSGQIPRRSSEPINPAAFDAVFG